MNLPIRTSLLTRSLGRAFLISAVAVLIPIFPRLSAQTNASSWTETTLFQFSGSPANAGAGSQPVILGAGGLIGASNGGGSLAQGSIYKLVPPTGAGAPWTFATLYSLNDSPDGGDALGGLLAKPGGVFFGVTAITVFEMSLNSTPTLTVLHTFTGPDGSAPNGPLISDGNGNLYGTTQGGGPGDYGLVYELSPPSNPGGPWTQTILHAFTGPSGDSSSPKNGLLMDKNGALYGTTEGTVFRLTPPEQLGGAWTETTLWVFAVTGGGTFPQTQLLMDQAGNLYGTTIQGGSAAGYGVVYRLSPPKAGATAWTETVLHRFTGHLDGARPQGGLSWGSGGVLYGTTSNAGPGGPPSCGTVYSLTPVSGTWDYSVLYNFQGPGDGCSPNTKLAVAPNGALFGTSAGGGGGSAAIFELHQ